MFQFRLLPVLIFVAMLAFSVRLAEFVTGVSHLSGSAYAEENAPTPAEPEKMAETSHEEKPAESQKEEQHAVTTDAASAKKKDEHAEAEKADHAEEKPMEWKDASDSDLDVSGVKMELLEDVSRRSAKLDALEKEMKAREAMLKVTEQEIDRKYQELTKLKTEIEGLLGKQTEEEEKRVASLVKIYEGMKPKDAARIFDTLDLDILVAVVSKMSERKISPILGLMDPERAKTLTIMLAQQKQLPSLGQ